LGASCRQEGAYFGGRGNEKEKALISEVEEMKKKPPSPHPSGVGEVPPFAWERRVGRKALISEVEEMKKKEGETDSRTIAIELYEELLYILCYHLQPSES
jgi:hypothetical protein